MILWRLRDGLCSWIIQVIITILFLFGATVSQWVVLSPNEKDSSSGNINIEEFTIIQTNIVFTIPNVFDSNKIVRSVNPLAFNSIR